MNLKEKINYLANICRGEVMIIINDHRMNNWTIRQHCADTNSDHPGEIESEVIDKMEETGIMYYVHAYPGTPTGFYSQYSHDLESAVDSVIKECEEYHSILST